MTIRAAVVALGALALAGCGAANRAADPAPSGRLLRGGPAPALAALADGSLLVGLLRTGEIWRVPAHGVPRRPFPRLRVSVDGQRGLLSLAAVHGRIYAAWTTRARRLVVGRLRPHAAPVIVWRGVDTATLANGGHLAGAPDGRLAVGIGDRQTGSPEGRLLSLDPAGPATQRPRTLSTGWNNPFAFAFTRTDTCGSPTTRRCPFPSASRAATPAAARRAR